MLPGSHKRPRVESDVFPRMGSVPLGASFEPMEQWITRLVEEKVHAALNEYRMSMPSHPSGPHIPPNLPFPCHGPPPPPVLPHGFHFNPGYLPQPTPFVPRHVDHRPPPPGQLPTPPQGHLAQPPGPGRSLPALPFQSQPPPGLLPMPLPGQYSRHGHAVVSPPLPWYRPAPSPPGLLIPSRPDMVTSLSEATLRQLLVAIMAQDSTDLAYTRIVEAYFDQHLEEQANERARALEEQKRALEEEKRALEEQSRNINFDSYSKSAWHAINTQYSRLSGSKQYDVSWDVTRQVVGCIESIGKQVKPASPYSTKLSALETLRKIAKMILLSNDTLGHEVRKHFQSEYCLVETMCNILNDMPLDDRMNAGRNESEAGKGSLLEKVAWVRSRAEGLVIDGLDVSEVYNMLCGEANNEEVEEGEEEMIEEDDEDNGEAEDEVNGASQDAVDTNVVDHQASDAQDAIATPSFSFDQCASRVDHIINLKYGSINGSSNYEQRKGLEAVSEVEAEVSLVKKQVSLPAFLHSPLASKDGALKALCTIGLLVVTTEGDTIAREIRRAFQHDDEIPGLIRSVLCSLSVKDVETLRQTPLLANVRHLIERARAYGIDNYDILEELLEEILSVPEPLLAHQSPENDLEVAVKESLDTRVDVFHDAMQQLFDQPIFAHDAADLEPLVPAVNERLLPGSMPFTSDEALRVLEELNERDKIMLSGGIVYRLDVVAEK